MPTQTINFAALTRIVYNGSDVNKLQGGGTRWWERVWVPSTTQTQVNNGYWTDPPGYWDFVITGSYYSGGSGRWNLNNPNLPMWPDGSPGATSNRGGYNWTYIGNYDIGDGYTYWYFQDVSYTGYDQYYDPPPYWTDNWVTVNVDNSYWAYYY